MTTRRQSLLLWSIVSLIVAGMLLVATGPMVRAWRCYLLHEDGQRADAKLVQRFNPGLALLELSTGPRTGQRCTAKVQVWPNESEDLGRILKIVFLEDQPEICVLESTIEYSGVILWSLSAGFGFGLLLLLSLAAFVQRSLSSPGWPRKRMDVDAGSVRWTSGARIPMRTL
ncbi:MAG: hypothetical protein GY725_01170 [bacterium]|nr:hypothetical protein [bacterium]